MNNTRFGFYNENTARNAPYIEINGVTFYFSYSTLVGIKIKDNPPIVMQNYWKGTTGKHLNWIDWGDKKERLSREAFEIVTNEALKIAGVEELPKITI